CIESDLVALLEEAAHLLRFLGVVESKAPDGHPGLCTAGWLQVNDGPHRLDRLYEWEALWRLNGSEREHSLRIEAEDLVLDSTLIADDAILAVMCLPVAANAKVDLGMSDHPAFDAGFRRKDRPYLARR